MAETHVLSALVEKYSKLSGKHIACNKEAVRLRTALTALEATIKLFEPDYDMAAIMPRRPYLRSTVRRGAYKPILKV